jgi:F0F1-type ATP synthase membrane subunit c/vacuolar-type H+-ATPase subunit K
MTTAWNTIAGLSAAIAEGIFTNQGAGPAAKQNNKPVKTKAKTRK